MPSLRQEIHKRNPFDLPEQEAFLNVMRTSSVLAVPFDRLFRAHGISAAGYNILRILRGAGSAGRCPAEIAADVIAEVPDMTRLLDRLERDGLVRRNREGEDRRRVLVRLTPAGTQLLTALDGPVVELHRAQLGSLARRDLASLCALLVKARDVAAEATVSSASGSASGSTAGATAAPGGRSRRGGSRATRATPAPHPSPAKPSSRQLKPAGRTARPG